MTPEKGRILSLSGTLQPGDIISYMEMCSTVGVNLQRGMNFRLQDSESVFLMSLRPGAPYDDQIQDDGRILIYEGHDVARSAHVLDPKTLDQPERNPGGSLTQNGLFAEAARKYKEGLAPAERVNVYQKIQTGIWVYNGLFELVDFWTQQSGGRKVFKFKLQFFAAGEFDRRTLAPVSPEDDRIRIVPSWVKQEVWKRDKGRCAYPSCGATSGLHFDHIIPYSKGGSSKDPANIQILCGRHNLVKHDKIE